MNVLPTLVYKRRHQLAGEHSDSITVLSFNPSGAFLASGGIDGRLCLWSTKSGKSVYVVKGEVGFLCISWIDDESLFAGMEDGVLLLVRITKVRTFNKGQSPVSQLMPLKQTKLIASGFPVHVPPLECISLSASQDGEILLATGAHAEVRIWKTTSGGECNYVFFLVV
jgi:WD40 repeat protein